MCEFFYDNYRVARRVFQEASDFLGWDIHDMSMNGSVAQINRFTNLQLLIFTTEIAIYRSFEYDYGVAPTVLMGHSIGEYAAFVCADALKFIDALQILKTRGKLSETILNTQSERLAIVENITCEELTVEIDKAGMNESVYISAYNSPTQFVLAGPERELNELSGFLYRGKARITLLPYSPPMHSRYMEKVRQNLIDCAREIPIRSFRYPVLSNVLGRAFREGDDVRELLGKHLVQPVQWNACANLFGDWEISCCIEISPRMLVSPFITEICPDLKSFCYGLIQDRERLDLLLAYEA